MPGKQMDLKQNRMSGSSEQSCCMVLTWNLQVKGSKCQIYDSPGTRRPNKVFFLWCS